MADEEPKSWAEAIKQYEQVKRKEPNIAPLDAKRSYRDGRYRSDQRQYDVTLQNFRDQEKEAALKKKEFETALAHNAKANAIAVRYESHYDLITHDPKVLVMKAKPGLLAPPKREEPPPPTRKERLDQFQVWEQKGRSRYYWDSMAQRDTHLISNRFHNHEEKMAQMREQQLCRAKEAAEARESYDPVKGVFFDAGTEEKFQQQREIAAKHHGSARLEKLPLSEKMNPSKAYSITSPLVVLDPERMAQITKEQELIRNAAKSHHSSSLAMYEGTRDHENDLVPPRHPPVSSARYRNTLHRGYDIVSNQGFKGRLGHLPAGLEDALAKSERVVMPKPHQDSLDALAEATS